MRGVAVNVLAILGLAGACSETPRPVHHRPQTPDKSSLFADPSLVPTRAGEHARRELALSGEIAAALATVPVLTELHADVELLQTNTRVLVAARLTADRNHDEVRATIRSVVRAVVGPIADGNLTVVLSAAPAPDPAPPPQRGVLLAIGLLGLGLSLGVAAERAWQRARSTAR